MKRFRGLISTFAVIVTIGLVLYLPTLFDPPPTSQHLYPTATSSSATVAQGEQADAPEPPETTQTTTPTETEDVPPLLIATTSTPSITPTEPDTPHAHYIEIVGGCGPYFKGEPCVTMHADTATTSPALLQLRAGLVLRVEEGVIVNDAGSWYTVIQDKTIRYPERVMSAWYVRADDTRVLPFIDGGDEELTKKTPTTTKEIVINLSEQTLEAYDEGALFMRVPISTGIEFNSTPVGTFRIFRKTPSRYMQGPIPGGTDQFYDMPGVPWNLYFTDDGAVIHGAYWHDKFGGVWSHGCVNLKPEDAKYLYEWAELRIKVTVKE